jgi:hypothetical protein
MSDSDRLPYYDEDQDQRPVRLGYEGSKVATIMIFAFLAFLIWSIWYMVSNGVPSLQEWLTDPPISLF